MSKPPAKTCSHCGRLLEPVIHGYTVDSNYNSVPCYMTGHQCPAIIASLNKQEESVRSDESLNADQRRNKIAALSYQNTWGS